MKPGKKAKKMQMTMKRNSATWRQTSSGRKGLRQVKERNTNLWKDKLEKKNSEKVQEGKMNLCNEYNGKIVGNTDSVAVDLLQAGIEML